MFGFQIKTKNYIIKQYTVLKIEFNDDYLHCPLYLHIIDLFDQVSPTEISDLFFKGDLAKTATTQVNYKDITTVQ